MKCQLSVSCSVSPFSPHNHAEGVLAPREGGRPSCDGLVSLRVNNPAFKEENPSARTAGQLPPEFFLSLPCRLSDTCPFLIACFNLCPRLLIMNL